MNIAVIFAGGVGTRMCTKEKPKQFLEVHGKPIIVHTIEIFEKCKAIDGIVVACIQDWIPYMEKMRYQYRLEKIAKIVPGGETGQLSIYNGLTAARDLYGTQENIVLIHDGVRPLITEELILKNIESVKENGTAISCARTTETFIARGNNNEVEAILDREISECAKAPQSFYLKDILKVHELALREGRTNTIDSCTLMNLYGKKLAIVECGKGNLKITTPDDFYIFRALYDAKENKQLADERERGG